MEAKTVAYNLITVTLIYLALYYGKELIMPFIIALVIWYLLNSLKRQIAKIKIGEKTLPRSIQIVVAASILIGGLFFIVMVFKSNVEEFVVAYPEYHDKILVLSERVTEYLDLPISMFELVNKLDLPNLISGLLNSSVSLLSGVALVTIYVLFIMAEEHIFRQKLTAIFNNKQKLGRFLLTIAKVDRSIRSYITIKTSLCFISAISSYIVLYFVGVDFAVLWAFLIFFLNYIPIIGAFVGPVFPTLIALMQFDGVVPAVLVISLLSGIQVVIGNFIEPKVLGERLNLSPLVVILSLAFWGTLWGIAGMFLCVPITVMLMIIFAQFPKTRGIAILLSGGKAMTNNR